MKKCVWLLSTILLVNCNRWIVYNYGNSDLHNKRRFSPQEVVAVPPDSIVSIFMAGENGQRGSKLNLDEIHNIFEQLQPDKAAAVLDELASVRDADRYISVLGIKTFQSDPHRFGYILRELNNSPKLRSVFVAVFWLELLERRDVETTLWALQKEAIHAKFAKELAEKVKETKQDQGK